MILVQEISRPGSLLLLAQTGTLGHGGLCLPYLLDPATENGPAMPIIMIGHSDSNAHWSLRTSGPGNCGERVSALQ